MILIWLRVIRIKFLLASVITVCLGLAIGWWHTNQFDLVDGLIIVGGVVALHASVDLLNDYWDFKRGIDTRTKRTKISGGSGVLPEGLLKPAKVFQAGIVFLIVGASAGIYFVIIDGFIIGLILAFAILSILFYSTKIVNWGLAEVFVTIKGTLIVLGTYFIQTGLLSAEAILGGIIAGTLSSFVLFITSFPDFDADKKGGRKTLVIILGKKKAVNIICIFPIIVYSIILIGSLVGLFSIFCLISFLALPLAIKAGLDLRRGSSKVEELIPTMKLVLTFSRVTGVLFIFGFLVKL